MSKNLFEMNHAYAAPMPKSIARHFAIVIDGEHIEMDEATHDAVMAKSKAERISAETAFAEINQIGAAA